VFEKIIAHPAKNAEETKSIETALFKYSESLSSTGRNEKAAEILATLSGVSGATRRAEAAYKAGIAYARSGKLEKAKTNWQLAAGDVSDKRYSTLATERLDRIR
jgi:TolA-binding protein